MGSSKMIRGVARRQGFTLMEILVATALILFMMLVLVQIFAVVAGTASLSQSLREMDQEANSAMTVLRSDLEGMTVRVGPQGVVVPHDPAWGAGYLEITENSVADLEGEDTDDVIAFTVRRVGGAPLFRGLYGFDPGVDGMLGTVDDVPRTIESNTAEVIYFVRNGKLYRRQLLVVPAQPSWNLYPSPGNSWNAGGSANLSWYSWFDISARPDPAGADPIVNTLADLSKRENRFAHDPRTAPFVGPPDAYPFRAIEFPYGTTLPFLIHKTQDFNGNNPSITAAGDPWFGRPLLVETSDARWDLPDLFFPTVPFGMAIQDADADGLLDATASPSYGSPSATVLRRAPEDLLLTNVLSFDVKVYDPGAPIFVNPAGVTVGPPYDLNANGTYEELNGATLVNNLMGNGAYVDLGYGANRGQANFYSETLPDRAPPFQLPTLGNLPVQPLFWHNGARSEPPARPELVLKRTYDTWSTSYENDLIDQDGIAGPDTGTNGIDDDGNGLIDERPDGIDTDGDGWVDEGTFALGNNLPEQEWEAPPPYWAPLRGIQIKIRVWDPTSGQAREYTVTHSFVK